MELSIGDQIIYEDFDENSFKGSIVDVSTNDDGEVTGYFAATNSGLHIHVPASSSDFCRLDESVSVF